MAKRPLADHGIHRLHIRSRNQRLHRVFKKYIDRGGRFYGGLHEGLPEEIRARTFINGSPVVELDFKAHHVRLLFQEYASIPYEKDPYEELCRTPDERPILKIVVLVALNAKTRENAIYGAIKKLREEGFRGECLTHAYINDCLERFKAVHEPLARFLHMGLGINLQFYDSLVMDEVLMRMVSEKIPALPVHDSVICPAEHEATLREVMTQSYEKIIGKGFLPVITKK